MRTLRGNERVTLSFLSAREGGRSLASAIEDLKDAGVKHVRREHSCYVGHVAVSVPARQARKAARILWGGR